jgi:hypothetical protein
VRELRAADAKRATVDPTLPLRLARDRMAVDELFAGLERRSGRDLETGAAALGLVGVGIAAVVGMLTSGD